MAGIRRTSRILGQYTPHFSEHEPGAFRVRAGTIHDFPGVLLPTADLVIERVMTDHEIPALSAAVAKGNSIVFSKGFGQGVTATSLFRIASNSKAITAAGILMLVQRGQLSLDERVFGPGAILGTTYGSKPYSNWLVQIEVQHLLQHLAGGWGSASNDPMFQSKTLNQAALIGQTLDADLLVKVPGTTFDYSNFGYCLLGRIIERKTGQTYEDFIRRSILVPAGAGAMRIGGDTLAQRAPTEVIYSAKGSKSPYSLPVRRMDSHGGWIASATDYVRFLRAIDKAAIPADMLLPAYVDAMRTPSMPSREAGRLPDGSLPAWGYGYGVGANGTDIGHRGALTGSRSVMWGGTGGDAWCVICTGGPPPTAKKKKNDALLDALDRMMWRVWDLV